METIQNITLLTGTSCESWKNEVKVLLLHCGEWELIEKPDEEEIDKK